MPAISVVVVTYDSRDELDCLRPLQNDDFDDYELILRDDEGIARARNAGVREASSDKLVFIDDDAVPQPGYLQRISNLLEEHAVVAGRVVDPRDHYFSRMGDERGYDQGDIPKMTDTLVGCNMAFRCEVFEEVGYFDENVDFGHDETLFADRVLNQFEIYYCPDVVVEHEFGNTIKKWWRKQIQYGPADVYKAKKQGEPIFSNWFDFVPICNGRSPTEIIVKTIGKTLRNASRIKAVIEGVPDPERN